MAPQLHSLRSILGLHTAVLTSSDGLQLSSVGDGAELLAAEISTLINNIERSERRLGLHDVSRVAITTAQFEIIALKRGSYTLAAALTRGQDTLSAQRILAQTMQDILPQLPSQQYEEGNG